MVIGDDDLHADDRACCVLRQNWPLAVVGAVHVVIVDTTLSTRDKVHNNIIRGGEAGRRSSVNGSADHDMNGDDTR